MSNSRGGSNKKRLVSQQAFLFYPLIKFVMVLVLTGPSSLAPQNDSFY
jgi:hypothetical protein